MLWATVWVFSFDSGPEWTAIHPVPGIWTRAMELLIESET